MQKILLILGLLALVTASLLLLRARWHLLTRRTHRLILAAAIIAVGIFVVGYGTHWTTTSDRLNVAFYWGAVVGYLLLLTLHSLNRPRWLTSLTALVLAAPILASSILLPLGAIFLPDTRRTAPLRPHLYASWQPFTDPGSASSGTDVDIFEQPRLLPFLRHSRLAGRFFDVRCNTVATEVLLQPDGRTVFVRCPPWPDSGARDDGAYLPLH